MPHIFILIQNGGYDGHGPPVQAFERENEAAAALDIANGPTGGWEIFKVPIWPEQAGSYFFIERHLPPPIHLTKKDEV